MHCWKDESLWICLGCDIEERVEWMDWSRGKGIWLLTDHVEQSPPAPPFLHPSLIPSPTAPRSALPSPLHPNMLAHQLHMDVLRPQCDQHMRPSINMRVSGEVIGQPASSHWVTIKKKKKLKLIPKSERGVWEVWNENRKSMWRNRMKPTVPPSSTLLISHLWHLHYCGFVSFHAWALQMLPTYPLLNYILSQDKLNWIAIMKYILWTPHSTLGVLGDRVAPRDSLYK